MRTGSILALAILLGFQPFSNAFAQGNASAQNSQSVSGGQAGSPIPRLEELVAQQNYSEALALANEHLAQWEGDTGFDFLYGMAALESGYPNEAVFAFERVAATGENATIRGRARLELARAYYLTNNLTASETLFNRVLASNPPPNVRANILAFLVLIDEGKRSQATRISWSLTGNAGHDDNINSATSDTLIDTPLIGQIELNPDGRKTADEFYDVTATMNYRRFFTRDKTLDFVLNANRRDNLSTDQFDLDNLRADLRYNHGALQNRFSYGLQAQKVFLDGTGFQQSLGLNASWQRSWGNGWYHSLSGSLTAMRYDNSSSPNNDLRDVNQQLVSFGITHIGNVFTNSTTVYAAVENAQDSIGEHNGRDFQGLAHSITWRLSSVHTPYLRINLQQLEHHDRHPVFFNTTRSDDSLSTTAGWLWQYNRNLLLSGELNYSDTDSNISLFEHSRTRIQAGIRYAF